METVWSFIAKMFFGILRKLSREQIRKILAGILALVLFVSMVLTMVDLSELPDLTILFVVAVIMFGFAGSMWYVWTPDSIKPDQISPFGPFVSVWVSAFLTVLTGLILAVQWVEDSCYRASPSLVKAVENQNAECVRFWLEQDTRHGNTQGETILHIAVPAGNPLVISILLTEGNYNPNVLNNDSITPLHQAVQAGHLDIVCLLLSHGALATFPSSDNVTPLDLALEQGEDVIAKNLRRGAC